MRNCYIDLRENGTMRVRVIVKIDGKEIRTSTTYKPVPTLTAKENIKAAELMGAALMERVRMEYEEEMENKNPTFRDFFEEYKKSAKSKLAATTYEFNLNTNEKFFLDTFGEIKLRNITKAMLHDKIQELVNKQNEHLEDPVCIQTQTVIRYVSPFRAVISLAVARGILERSPFDGGMDYPKVYTPQIKCMEQEDYADLVKKFNSMISNDATALTKIDLIIAIAAFAGLRRGEIVALRWEDLENLCEEKQGRARISVNSSAYKIKGEKQKRGNPKTPASRRTFVMPEILSRVLMSWKNINIDRGISVSPNDYVISNRLGEMVSLDSASRWVSRYFEANGLPHIRLHSLRHTFASVMVRNNMDIETLKRIMGHDDISTTQIYMDSFRIKEDGLMSDVNMYNEEIINEHNDHK